PLDNSTWTDSDWPESPPSGDETQWSFDPATGLLHYKQYADATQTVYTYTPDGKLKTRTWARAVGDDPLVTTYHYYGEGISFPEGFDADEVPSGDLGEIEYSENAGMTDIFYAYRQSGRVKAVLDAAPGTRTFTYNPDLSLDAETLPSDYFGS